MLLLVSALIAVVTLSSIYKVKPKTSYSLDEIIKTHKIDAAHKQLSSTNDATVTSAHNSKNTSTEDTLPTENMDQLNQQLEAINDYLTAINADELMMKPQIDSKVQDEVFAALEVQQSIINKMVALQIAEVDALLKDLKK